MGYEKVFEKPYPGGWKDLPSHDTLVTAEILDSYDEAFEHIENHLEDTPAIFPITATGGMTQPVGIDENGRLVTVPSSSGGGTASEITYDNTESGLESTDVQGAIDELAAGAGEKVTPVPKTEGMTQEVGIDENGELWTAPGGGGSGSATKIDTLFEDTTYEGVTSGTINLSRTVTDYDFIKFTVVMTSSGHDLRNSVSYDIDTITDYIIDSNKIMTLVGYGEYINLRFSNTQTITVDSVQNLGVIKIVGIKYDSGGGSGFDETVILDTPVQVTVSTPITLDEAITNYDQIRIRAYMLFNGMKLWSDNLFQSDDFILGDTNDQHWIFIDNNDLCYFSMSADGTQLVIKSVAGSVHIGEVVGIKFSGVSSDSWTKLLDVREESSQTASSYTLADDITNYNTIAVSVYSVINSMYYSGHATIPVDMIDVGTSRHNAELDHTRVCTFAFPTATSIQNVDQTGGTYVYQVYGK